MKKFVSIVLCLSLLVQTTPVYAVIGGGGTGNSSHGTSGAGSQSRTDWWEYGDENYAEHPTNPGSYRVQLVYKDKNKSSDERDVWADVVVQSNDYVGSNSDHYNRNNSVNLEALVRKYASDRNLPFVNSGALVKLINGVITSSIDEDKGLTNDDVIDTYIQQFKGLANYKGGDLTKPQDDNPGRFDSYGYRILIEKLTLFARGDNDSTYDFFVSTRREAILYNFVSFENDMWTLFGGKYAPELYTTKDDIGITKSFRSQYSSDYVNSYNGGYSKSCLGSYTCGDGYNIIWFKTSQYQRNYDYSIDAACKNCNVGTNNNHTYVIQDTNNFEAIRNSSSSKVNNVKNYYIKSGAGYSGVYCREEFFVQFPNTVDNRLTLATGRYFTINEDFKKWSDSDNSGITENAAIPNFEPILVTHKRQCTTSDNSNNGKEQLKNFAVASLSNFKSNNGEVKLKYTENMTGSKYKTDFVTLRSKEQSTFVGGVDVTGTTSINKNNINIGSDVGGYPVLTMSTTRTYKLPANFYRYVRISDGLSMINVNGITSTDLSTKYNDLGFSTLPISYKNTNYENAGSVQFYYELPAKSAYTNDIKTAYANENYFIDDSHSNDIKTLYNYTDSEKSNAYMNYDYNNNACIKLYGDASKASSCIAEHKTKKIGNCKNVNSLNNKNANEGYVCNLSISNGSTGYKCKIENGKYYLYGKNVNEAEYKKVCPDPTLCPPDKPCPKGPSCEYYNDKYYDNEGNQVDEEIYKEKCSNACKIVDTGFKKIYYDNSGQKVDKETYEEKCNNRKCVNGVTGTYSGWVQENNSWVYKTKWCTSLICPYSGLPPMEGGVCPSGIKVIYRPIDLTNPFPGQDANTNGRLTGANWGFYNTVTNTYDRTSDNQTVRRVITNKSSTTYSGDPLYSITLDTNKINSIRTYNNTHKYDDFTLECQNGKTCISTFLNRSSLNVSGKCAGTTHSTFESCRGS